MRPFLRCNLFPRPASGRRANAPFLAAGLPL